MQLKLCCLGSPTTVATRSHQVFKAQLYMLQKLCYWHHRLDSLASCSFQGHATVLTRHQACHHGQAHHARSLSPTATRAIITITDGTIYRCWAQTSSLYCKQGSNVLAKRLQGPRNIVAKQQWFSHHGTLFQLACIMSAWAWHWAAPTS